MTTTQDKIREELERLISKCYITVTSYNASNIKSTSKVKCDKRELSQALTAITKIIEEEKIKGGGR